MLALTLQFLFTAAWIVMLVAIVAIAAFVTYMAIDYVCDRIWGKPFLTEKNRKKWWV